MDKKKKKKLIISSSVVGGFLILVLVGLMVSGSLFRWGPFWGLFDIRISGMEGNNEKYSYSEIEKDKDSPLKDKHIAFLGSSITAGYAALGESMADFLGAKDGIIFYKEAVNGTTLADTNSSSYVSRLDNFSKDLSLDLFVLQLSTNDANGTISLGEVDSKDKNTTLGAINYIVDYVSNTYNCPTLLYSNPKYDNEKYVEMVNKSIEIDEKRDDLYFLNLFDDENFNDISEEERALYMYDTIHPTRAGYSIWWLPEFEKAIESILNA